MRGSGSPPGRLSRAAPGRIEAKLRRYTVVAVLARGRQLQHSRNLALPEDRIAEDLVVHVAPFGGEPGVLDVPDDLDFVHAVTGTGGAHHVFLDHHAAHVVRAAGEAQLTDFSALRDP